MEKYVKGTALSNQEFAEYVTAAGCSCGYSMASKIRSGNRRPSINMLFAICGAFDLDVRKVAQNDELFLKSLPPHKHPID